MGVNKTGFLLWLRGPLKEDVGHVAPIHIFGIPLPCPRHAPDLATPECCTSPIPTGQSLRTGSLQTSKTSRTSVSHNSKNPMDAKSTVSRLEGTKPVIEEIMTISGAVGLSYGKTHHSQIIRTANFGFRNHEEKMPIDSKTKLSIVRIGAVQHSGVAKSGACLRHKSGIPNMCIEAIWPKILLKRPRDL